MSPNFLGLPSELRNRIYELVLVRQDRIEPLPKFKPPQKFSPGLFRTNKIIHQEATSLFYAQNCFDFCLGTAKDVISFLDQIGRMNAGYIHSIYIDFPLFESLDADHVVLRAHSIRILEKIQSECGNLRTLSMMCTDNDFGECDITNSCNPDFVDKALRLVDTRCRAISSLREINVVIFRYFPYEHIDEEMKNLGWTITFEVDEWEDEYPSDGYSEISDSDHLSFNSEDDYDIDSLFTLAI
ncbi:uncharacterized protein K460DRAFT_367235 [Cucurbitaria berberidis CBS 394.84]|uniref:F-box domain-containing protein n=1 Tax=Cucurbitaria berberidis CBS 394.84 TaxID=1168544 RepID=A0A9P4GHV3_9PLEO|nr:uncharacterized protein K460DRAFT_367235 [Cucurbitaria berberidis CBS 394.84]KAF1846453.1 hypothetical protein K460DRAFT_367235 [Cucurbitaria berberidis CBS 394.84]